MFTVVYTPLAVKQLEELPASIQARIGKIVARLANWPAVSGAKPLRGDLAGHFRIRTGDYRVQFRLTAEQVIIEQVGHRDGFYES